MPKILHQKFFVFFMFCILHFERFVEQQLLTSGQLSSDDITVATTLLADENARAASSPSSPAVVQLADEMRCFHNHVKSMSGAIKPAARKVRRHVTTRIAHSDQTCDLMS